MHITLLGRQTCHLCEEAAAVLDALRDRFQLVITSIDIDEDDDLTSKYGLRIPVILGPDGDVLAEGVVTEEALLVTLAA